MTEIQPQSAATETDSKTAFGFWVYILTDCVLFASLFAAYAVLSGNTFGGPALSTLSSLPYVLTETLILLTSSFTCGLAVLAAQAGRKGAVRAALTATLLLGVIFLAMEMSEFSHLIAAGNGPQASGALSSYFTLVGTHGLHIAIGLLWLVILLIYLVKRGLTPGIKRKLVLFSLFWHFLDVVWIFIFTIVYLYGHI